MYQRIRAIKTFKSFRVSENIKHLVNNATYFAEFTLSLSQELTPQSTDERTRHMSPWYYIFGTHHTRTCTILMPDKSLLALTSFATITSYHCRHFPALRVGVAPESESDPVPRRRPLGTFPSLIPLEINAFSWCKQHKSNRPNPPTQSFYSHREYYSWLTYRPPPYPTNSGRVLESTGYRSMMPGAGFCTMTWTTVDVPLLRLK